MFVMLLTNPEKSTALKAAAQPPVVLTTTSGTPVGLSIAIPNGDRFVSSGEGEIHDDAYTTGTSLISGTLANMSATHSTIDAGDDDNTNTQIDAEEEGGGDEDVVFDEEFDDGDDLMPDDWTFPGFIALIFLVL